MEAYIQGLLTASVAAGILSAAAPESKNGGMRKYLKYLTSLAVLVILITPIVPLLTDMDHFGEQLFPDAGAYGDTAEPASTEQAAARVLEQSGENLETAAESLICGEFGLHADEVQAEVTLEGSGLTDIALTEIVVTISSREVCSAQAVELYVSEAFGCDCTVRFT